MGVPTCSVNDFVLVDIAGLKSLLQQILDSLGEQSREQVDQDKRVNTLEALLVGDDVSQTPDRRPGASGCRPEASLREMPARISSLEDRQATTDRSRAELSGLIEQEGAAREALEERVAKLEQRATTAEANAQAAEANAQAAKGDAKASEAELHRCLRTLEARVNQAEAKASDSRRTAKDCHTLSEESTATVNRLEQKVEALSRRDLRECVADSVARCCTKDDLTKASDRFEAMFRDMEADLRAKADQATMEAMRVDADQTSRAIRNSVQQLVNRFGDMEERVRSAARNHPPVVQKVVSICTDSNVLEGASPKTGTTHCLICGTDRSPSPAPAALGSDGTVYRHVAGEAILSPTTSADIIDALAASGPAGAYRGSSGPPSRPGSAMRRPQAASGNTSTSQTVVASAVAPRGPCNDGTSAATTRGSDPRAAKTQRKHSNDGGAPHWPSSRQSSRPCSAQHRSTSRPSSAGCKDLPVGAASNIAASRPSSGRRGSERGGAAVLPAGPYDVTGSSIAMKDGLPLSSYLLTRSFPTFEEAVSSAGPAAVHH